jgi:hypothetical protein
LSTEPQLACDMTELKKSDLVTVEDYLAGEE